MIGKEQVEVTYTDHIPIICYNESVINIFKNPILYSKTKNAPIKYCYLREQARNHNKN